MATAATADAYLQQIYTARTQLHACFLRAHELLTEREARLLRELETIQNNYEKETNSHKEELQGLEVSKQALKNNLRNNDILNEALATINRQISQIMKLSSETRTIKFQWNNDFDRSIQHTGEIITKTDPQPAIFTQVIPQPVNFAPVIPQNIPDYKNKSIPVITSCKHNLDKSNTPGELCWPHGLAIEPQSGRIYIAEYGNDRVQVFTLNGEYCFLFSSSNMNKPWGICIANDTVFVSQLNSDCITLHKLDGTFITKVGSEGTRNGQFKFPRGIAVSPTTEHLYVCDSFNHRLQIFNRKRKFLLMFANNLVNCPLDVKLTQHLVIVLDEGDPCIHLFNITNQSKLSSIISKGDNKQINRSLFFTIDRELNLLLTDRSMNCVCVFNQTGELITKFGKRGDTLGEFVYTTGIAMDNQNRIVVVSQNKNNALQLF